VKRRSAGFSETPLSQVLLRQFSHEMAVNGILRGGNTGVQPGKGQDRADLEKQKMR
jgi:hypothetical protein